MANENTCKYKFTLGIGYANSVREEILTPNMLGFSDADWDSLTMQEKDEELDNYWTDWSNDYIDGGWEKL